MEVNLVCLGILLVFMVDESTPPVKKCSRNIRLANSTPDPPVRTTRLHRHSQKVVKECSDNIRTLCARKKDLLLQFERKRSCWM